MRSAASRVWLFVLLFAFAASPLAATEHVVTSNADSGAGSLRQAIADAADGDTITFNLSAGQETITISSELVISWKSVSIQGQNLAVGGSPITIQVTSPGVSGFCVFDLSNTGKAVTLLDLTIKGGDVAGTGGGIKLYYGTLNLERVTITGSSAGFGGGIYCNNAVLTLTDSTVSDATATVDYGGGICAYYSTVSIERCTFHGNHANTRGGAVYSSFSTTTIGNSTFSGNTCNGPGGAIFVLFENITIDSCTIANNHSDQDDSGYETGGGLCLFATSTTLTVKNTVLAYNYRGSGTSSGDDYYHSSGTLVDAGYNVVGVQNRATEGNAGKAFDQTTDILYNTKYGTGETSYNCWNKNSVDLSNQTLSLASTLSYAGGYTDVLAVAGGFLADAEGAGSTEETADQRGYRRVSTAITRGAFQYHGVVARRSSQSWDEGYASIAAALAAADSGETIQLVSAVILEFDIGINKSVTVEGQGADVTVVQAARTEDASTNRVFDIQGDGLTVTVASLTVRHGKTSGSATGNGGAGIRVRPSETPNVVTLRSLAVCYNRNESTDSVSSHGGGVFVHGVHDVRIQGCDVHHNIHQYRHGGGLAFKGPDTSNSGRFWIENSEVHHNACLAAGVGHGGGIYTEYYDNTSLSRIEGCTVYQNTATEMGGGISLHDTRVDIVNTTIAANSARGSAGGLQVGGSSQATLTGVTVAENRSDSDGEGGERGGGVHLGWAALIVRNTILAHNLRGSGSGTSDDYYYSAGTLTDSGYNIVESQDGVSTGVGKTFTAGTDLLGVQENLYLATSLAENGGSTQTLAVTSTESVARAIPASAGDGAYNGCGRFDQRGYFRSMSGNRTIGAYEYGGVAPADGDFITRSGVTGSWSSAANWYRYDGTTESWGIASVAPTADDGRITVDSDASITVTGSVTIDQTVVQSGGVLTVNGEVTLTVANGSGDDLVCDGSLTVSGGLVLADGALVDANGAFNATSGVVTFSGAGDLKLGGTVTSLGTFTAGTGTVWFDGASQTVPAVAYHGLRLVGSGTATLGSGIDVNGALVVGGSISALSSSGTLTLGGTADFGTSVSSVGGTVVYDGAGQTVDDLTYSTLRLTGTGTVTLRDGVTVESALVVGSTVSALSSSGTLTLSGTADFGSGVSTVGGTVVYNGSDPSIDDLTYSKLTVGGTGTATLQGSTTIQSDLIVGSTLAVGSYTLTVDGSTDINGTVTVSTGTVDLNGAFDATGGTVVFTGAGQLRLGGTVTSLGTFTAGTGTVRYDRAGDQTVSAGSYHNLTLTGSGIRTLAGDIAIAGLFTIDGVTFVPGEHTVTYAGSGDQTIASGITYYDLTLSGSGTETVSGALTVSHALSVGASSVLDVNGALTVSGSISNSGTIRASSTVALPTGSLGGTFVYDGGDQTIDADPTYSAVTLAGTGTKTFSGTTTATGGVTVDADLTVAGADQSAIVQAAASQGTGTSRVFTIPSGRTVTVSDLQVRYGNLGSGAGGGISSGGALTLERVVVSDNEAAGGGGGIHVATTGSLVMQSSTVSGNTAGEGSGGGIRCEGTLSLTDCTVADNTMSSASHTGGGVYLGGGGGSHTIEGCTISGNLASGPGGGVSVDAEVEDEQTFTLDITRTTIAGNISNRQGGGLHVAVSNTEGTAGVSMNACTVAYNHADYDSSGSERGGGVYFDSTATILTVKNTMVARNYRGSGTDTRDDYYYSQGTLTDQGYNVVESQDGASTGVGKTFTAGTDLLGVQENLYLASSLADNGGSTQTLAVTSTESVARAIPASAGSGTYNGCGGFDQRGYYRSTSGNRTIGAYEFGGAAPANGDFITQPGVTGSWSSAANWYRYNGTTGAWECATVSPTSTHGRITVDTGGQITVDIDVTADQLVVASGGSLTVAAVKTLTVANGSGDDLVSDGSLTVSGGLVLADGALVDVNGAFNATSGVVTFSGAGDLKLGGTGSSSLGTFTAGTGTVWFDGASQTVPAVAYHGLRLVGSGTATLGSGIDVNGTLVVGGSISALSSSGTFTLSGTADFGTEVSSVGGTVVYDGAAQTVDDLTYSTLRLTGTGTVTLRDGVTVESALVVGSSVSALSSTGTLTLGGTADFGTGVSSVGGTVVYNGSDPSIDDVTYTNLTVGSTGAATLQGDTTVQSSLVVQSTLVVGSYTLAVNGTTDINGTVTVSTGTVDLNGAFDATGGDVVFTGAGQLRLGGTVTSLGTFTAGTGTVRYDRAGDQTVSAGSYHNLTLTGSGIRTLAGDIAIAGLFTIDGVTFVPGEYTVTYAGSGDQTIVSGITYYDLTLSGSGTETVSGALTVSHTFTVGSSSVLDVNGALTVSGSISNSGTIRASSTVALPTGSLGGTFVYDGAGQTVDDLTYSTLRLTGTGTVTLRDGVTVESALVVGSSVSALSSTGTLTLGGTADFGTGVSSVGGTVVYNGSDPSIDDVAYSNLTVGGTGTATLQGDTTVQGSLVVQSTLAMGLRTLAVNGSTDINGTVTVSTGTVDANGVFDATGGNVVFTGAGQLQLGGTVTSLGTFTAGTGTVRYDRAGDQTVPGVAYHHVRFSGGGEGTKTLGGAISASGNLVIDEGTTLAVSGSNHGVSLQGNWSNQGTFTCGEGTVTFDGSSGQSITGSCAFFDVTIANTHATALVDASGATGFAVSHELCVTDGTFCSASDYHDVTIGSGGSLELTGAITVSGDWSNQGTLIHNNHAVILDGTVQAISGATTFYDLTKNVTSAATLTFANGTANRTTVTHALDLQGVDGGRLLLRSLATGDAWEIDPRGTRTVAYLDVKDSTNMHATAIDAAGTGSVNSGHNTNWIFADPVVITQAVDEITMGTATGHGTITALGDPASTQHGVCWSKSVNPTTSDSKTEEGAVTGTGSFTSSLTGLAPGATYHVRAYATSEADTIYGEDVTFVTLSHPWVGVSLVPASVLLFPTVDSRNGRGTGTLVSVTNTNTSRVVSPRSGYRSGDVQLHYYYVGGPDTFHRVFDRKEFLTPGDTLTVFAGSHNPEMEAGYLVVVAEDPESGAAIQFNDLIGDEIVVDVAENKVWTVPAVGHRARVTSGPTDGNGRRKTDANGNGKIDFDGVEYDFYPDHLYLGSFFEQTAALEGQLILVSGLGGLYRVWVNLLIYDNEEESFSRGFEFTGWTSIPLRTLSQVTARLGGAASEPAVGWMRIDGDHAIHTLTGVVWSGEPAGSSPDPPLQGAFVQRFLPGPGFAFGHLLHHSGMQNGYEFP